MKNFACSNCGNKVYFENVVCLQCGHPLGFDAEKQSIVALSGSGERYCANATYAVCNWLTPHDGSALCKACDLNRTIPNLAESGSLQAWRDLERAKKRLVYSLLRFGLPFDASSPKGPLSFNFVRSAVTGHLNGVVTIDIMETDAVERERQRQQFGEPYRSLLGHLRHESGHYYWSVLLEASGRLDEFRTLFGDERSDYGAAIARHHAHGPAARLVLQPRLRLRQRPSLGGLGRDLGALPAHRRHARYGRSRRHGAAHRWPVVRRRLALQDL